MQEQDNIRESYQIILQRLRNFVDAPYEARPDEMKSLLTVCKFSFVEKTSGDAIPVKTLTIAYGGTGSDDGTYKGTAKATLTEGEYVEATGLSVERACG